MFVASQPCSLQITRRDTQLGGRKQAATLQARHMGYVHVLFPTSRGLPPPHFQRPTPVCDRRECGRMRAQGSSGNRSRKIDTDLGCETGVDAKFLVDFGSRGRKPARSEGRFGRLISVRVRQSQRQQVILQGFQQLLRLDTVLLYMACDSADPNLLRERNPGDGISSLGLMRFKGAESAL